MLDFLRLSQRHGPALLKNYYKPLFDNTFWQVISKVLFWGALFIMLKCGCKEQTVSLKVEADFADPIWCSKCGYNLDLDEIPISDKLRQDLFEWVREYGKWIDWESDTLIDNAFELEDKHNELGQILTEEVIKELGHAYKIVFSPSTSARFYAYMEKTYPFGDK